MLKLFNHHIIRALSDNTYYHSDSCNLPDLEELYKGKPHLEKLLKGRKWTRVRARIDQT
jgi:hypothetical protein